MTEQFDAELTALLRCRTENDSTPGWGSRACHPNYLCDVRTYKSGSVINTYQTEHQDIFFTEGFLMDDRTSQPNNDLQLNEAVRNACVKKNETQDKIRFARGKKC